jgi:hypothetical protein
MTPLRQIILFFLRCAFALMTIWAIGAILSEGFTVSNTNRYISQMKDHHSGGEVIITLMLSLAITASVIALLHKRLFGAILRGNVAGLVYVILTTNASSSGHNAAYLGVAILYSFTAIMTVMLVAMELSAFIAVAIPFGLLAMFSVGSLLGGGPTGQKVLLISFLLVECSAIFICFPRRLQWVDGLEHD